MYRIFQHQRKSNNWQVASQYSQRLKQPDLSLAAGGEPLNKIPGKTGAVRVKTHKQTRGSRTDGFQRSNNSKHLKGEHAEEGLEALRRNDWLHISTGEDKV